MLVIHVAFLCFRVIHHRMFHILNHIQRSNFRHDRRIMRSMRSIRHTSMIISKEFKQALRHQMRHPGSKLEAKHKMSDIQVIRQAYHEQQQLQDVIQQALITLEGSPPTQQCYLYKFLADTIEQQKPEIIVNLLIDLCRKVEIYQNLTPNQLEVIEKYGMDLADL